MRCSSVVVAVTASFALGSAAFGKSCTMLIGGDDQMRFVNVDKPTEVMKRIEIGAECTEVKLTLKHVGKLPKEAMGHNWILTSATWQDLATAASKAGLAAEYVPQNDPRVLAATKLVGGGQATDVTFSTAKLERGKEYDFLCGFPAHAVAGMNGKLVVKGGASPAH
jgi:azurin